MLEQFFVGEGDLPEQQCVEINERENLLDSVSVLSMRAMQALARSSCGVLICRPRADVLTPVAFWVYRMFHRIL